MAHPDPDPTLPMDAFERIEAVELVTETDPELLLRYRGFLMQAGIPVELWWGPYGGRQERIEDDALPEGPGVGTLLVAPGDVARAELAFRRGEEARIRAHLSSTPRELARWVLFALVLAGVPLLITGLVAGWWGDHVPLIAGWMLVCVALLLYTRKPSRKKGDAEGADAGRPEGVARRERPIDRGA